MNTVKGQIRWLPKQQQDEKYHTRGDGVNGAVIIIRDKCFEPAMEGLSDHSAVLQTEHQTQDPIQHQGPREWKGPGQQPGSDQTGGKDPITTRTFRQKTWPRLLGHMHGVWTSSSCYTIRILTKSHYNCTVIQVVVFDSALFHCLLWKRLLIPNPIMKGR